MAFATPSGLLIGRCWYPVCYLWLLIFLAQKKNNSDGDTPMENKIDTVIVGALKGMAVCIALAGVLAAGVANAYEPRNSHNQCGHHDDLADCISCSLAG